MRIGLLLLGLLLVGWGSAVAAPVLKVDDPVWNIGVLVTGQDVARSIRISNAGDTPLVIEKVEHCCAFHSYLDDGTRLLPGESIVLRQAFSSFKQIGELRAENYIVSNDPKRPRFPLFVVAQIVATDYALAALDRADVDLGVVDVRDRVPFVLKVKNEGQGPLALKRIESRQQSIHVVSTDNKIAAGAEGVLKLEFLPQKPGPIEETVVISSNDALDRTLECTVKGYVTQRSTPQQGVTIYPVGKQVEWNPDNRSFRYSFSLNNSAPRDIEVVKLDSSLPFTVSQLDRRIAAGATGGGEVKFSLQVKDVPVTGYVYLTIAIPVEVH